MSETYTPGPWHVGPHYKSDVESRHGRICECGITRGPQAEANARLIATAPDLLASLKEMREALASLMRHAAQHEDVIEDWVDELQELGILNGFGVRAQAAIAKAEGHSVKSAKAVGDAVSEARSDEAR